MLVALYARHSGLKQSKSTADQIARLRKYCDQQGWTVVEAFIDEAKSGAAMQNRRGVKRLMDRASKNIFEVVLCEDLSRLSRDQSEVAWLYKRLSFLHIGIESLTEGRITELHIGLKGTMNALYLKDLADKTHRGVMAAVRKGGAPGGRLYGYDVVRHLDAAGEPVRGLREINETEAAVVRQIFESYAAGQTLRDICSDLNKQGIDPPQGPVWRPTALIGTESRKTGLLRQTQYKGVVTFNKLCYRKHPETGKRLSVVRPEDEWLIVPAPELTIIEPALFDQVQKMIAAKSSMRAMRQLTKKVLTTEEKAAQAAERQAAWRARQMRPRQRVFTIVAGRLWCPYHQAKIDNLGTSAQHGPVYGCRQKDCRNRNIKLNAVIFPLLIDALARIDEKTVAAHFASAEAEAERNRLQGEIDGLKTQLEAVRAEVANVIGALGRQARTEEIRGYFDQKSMEIRRLKLDIELLEDRLARLATSVSPAALLPYRLIIKRLRANPTEKFATEALRPVVKRITMFAEWDYGSEKWRRSVKLDLDYDQLLRLRIPRDVG